MKERVHGLLSELGFTGVEAAAYVALLTEPNATGYRISRLIDKPVPNTYKALDSLRAKGAVVLDDSAGARTYVALPIGEYLDGVKRSLAAKQEELEKGMQELAAAPMKGGIYQLTSVEQVYERCRTMLGGAKSVILLDAFPAPIGELQKDIEAAVKRGVKVFIKAYAPLAIPGCDILSPHDEAPHLKVWKGDWLNMVADSCEFVQSFLKKDGTGVHEAIWSRNCYLALLTYNGLVNELTLTRVVQLLRAGGDTGEIVKELRRLGKRYLEEGPMLEAVPKPWLTGWKPKPAERRKWAPD